MREQKKVCACGAPLSRFGPPTERCRACYQKAYRNRPGRREAHRRAVVAYQLVNPEKRRRWVHNYLARIGWYNPDLTALRAAIRRVDEAVAEASRR